MARRLKFNAMLDTDCVRFVSAYDGAEWGYVEVDQKPYPVRYADGEFVGTVDRLCDALPLMLDVNEKKYLAHRERELAREMEEVRYEPIALRK